MNKGKVLVIAYRFPPQGGGGVQRTLKFVRYLNHYGWDSVVHTVKNPYWPLRDETLLGEVPDHVRVYRTCTFEFERLQQTVSRWINHKSDQANRSSGGGGIQPDEHCTGGGGVMRRARRLLEKYVLMPDPQIAWLPGAFARTLAIARREKIDLIYTSSPPNSLQVLGLLLKKTLKKPWVVDFRDPWTEGVRRKLAYINNSGRRRIEESLEHAIARNADHFIVNTLSNQKQFIEKYPILESKLTTLTNGFDPADFQNVSEEHRFLEPGQFHLTLTGNVEAMFDAKPFFQAVREVVDEHPEVGTDLRINFVGTRAGQYKGWVRDHGLEVHIRFIDYMPHADSIQHLAESDVLFLCQIPEFASASVKLPGKIFEYLYLRKPVLALTLPGMTSEILEEANLGTVVEPNDVAAIKMALINLHQQWRRGRWNKDPDETFINRFDRVQLTKRLASIFEMVTRSEVPRAGRHGMERQSQTGACVEEAV